MLQQIDFPALSKKQQLGLLGLAPSSYYYKPAARQEADLANMIYDIWQETPIYGYRKITHLLRQQGYLVNHKRVLRLMQEMNIWATVPGPHTSKPGKQRLKLPYLLADKAITAPHQAWQTDITYIRLPQGFVYLLAFIDVFSRAIIAWRVSNTMDTHLALTTLDAALCKATPQIINMDQGTQFTSTAWLEELAQHGIQPSMTAKGRCLDNVYIERFWRSLKVEDLYLNPPESLPLLKQQIEDYMHFYNTKRPHQALDYRTPNALLTMSVN